MSRSHDEWPPERLRAEQLATFAELYPGVTHEVRNLLHAINYLAETLLRRAPSDDPIFRKRMKQIQEYAVLGGDLTTTFLRLAQPHCQIQAGNVAEAIEDVLSLFENKAQTLKYVVDLAHDLPAVGMPTLYLELILTNLFKNAFYALKATADPTIRLRAHKSDNGVEITLWNNGPPLSDCLLLQPELQFTTKDGNEGSGLGLRVIREMLQQVDSELRISNCPEGGVQFSFMLPLAGGDK